MAGVAARRSIHKIEKTSVIRPDLSHSKLPKSTESPREPFLNLLGILEMSADRLDCLVARVSVHLFHDAMKVVLDGKFGQVQLRRNFFVGEALRNEGNKLPLAEC